MSLPVFRHVHFRKYSLDELNSFLRQELNLKYPVAIHLEDLNLNQQREYVGFIENFFVSSELSYKFPYPVYLITHHEKSISKMPVVSRQDELPSFYNQKESRMNVKESHLASKNKLLQQEVSNSDVIANEKQIIEFGKVHRVIHHLDLERTFYMELINKMKKHG